MEESNENLRSVDTNNTMQYFRQVTSTKRIVRLVSGIKTVENE